MLEKRIFDDAEKLPSRRVEPRLFLHFADKRLRASLAELDVSAWKVGRTKPLPPAQENFAILDAYAAGDCLDFAARAGEETLPDGADRIAPFRRHRRRDAREYLALAFLVGARQAFPGLQRADAVGDVEAPHKRGENRVIRRIDFIPQLVQFAHFLHAPFQPTSSSARQAP